MSHTITYTHPHTVTMTVERESTAVSVTDTASNMGEFLELCRRLALAFGYQQESWEDAITDAADLIIATDD